MIAAVHRSLSCVFDCVMRVMKTYVAEKSQYSQQEQNLMVGSLIYLVIR